MTHTLLHSRRGRDARAALAVGVVHRHGRAATGGSRPPRGPRPGAAREPAPPRPGGGGAGAPPPPRGALPRLAAETGRPRAGGGQRHTALRPARMRRRGRCRRGAKHRCGGFGPGGAAPPPISCGSPWLRGADRPAMALAAPSPMNASAVSVKVVILSVPSSRPFVVGARNAQKRPGLAVPAARGRKCSRACTNRPDMRARRRPPGCGSSPATPDRRLPPAPTAARREPSRSRERCAWRSSRAGARCTRRRAGWAPSPGACRPRARRRRDRAHRR